MNPLIRFSFYLNILSISIYRFGLSAPLVEPGKALEIPQSFYKAISEPYNYIPLDKAYWDDVTNLLNKKNYQKIIEISLEHKEKLKINETHLKSEVDLAIAMALEKLELPTAAFNIYIKIVNKNIGSQIAQGALDRLNYLAQTDEIDQTVLEDLLVNNDFGPVHEDLQSFISFYKGMFLLQMGMKDWAKKEINQIKKESYWDFKKEYLSILSYIAHGNIDETIIKFETFISKNIPQKIAIQVKLQLARVYFEKGDFLKSLNLYKSLELPLREKGRVILEMAWANYYLKEYSNSLGMLNALKTPYYKTSVSPEAYILEMINYKELCYFDNVSTISNEFEKKYKNSITNIEKRVPLTKDKELMFMSIKNLKFQHLANFITQLRNEKENLKDKIPTDFFKKFSQDYINKENEIKDRVMSSISKQIKNMALEILDIQEQVVFIDYVSSLDALKTTSVWDRINKYESDKISKLTFSKIFWPVKNEHWFDELENYKTLASSRCQ